jgi:hypothetical protein
LLDTASIVLKLGSLAKQAVLQDGDLLLEFVARNHFGSLARTRVIHTRADSFARGLLFDCFRLHL